MSGSKGSLESSSHALRSGSAAPAPPVRILRNAPAPDQWTLVSEMNMEKREPCEVSGQCGSKPVFTLSPPLQVWRSGVHHLLFKMKDELVSSLMGLQ